MNTSKLVKSLKAAMAEWPILTLMLLGIFTGVVTFVSMILLYLQHSANLTLSLVALATPLIFGLLYFLVWLVAASLRRIGLFGYSAPALQGLSFFVFFGFFYSATLAVVGYLMQLFSLSVSPGAMILLMVPSCYSFGSALLLAFQTRAKT